MQNVSFSDGSDARFQTKMAYSDFLQRYPWDFYITTTFRKPRVDGIYWSGKLWKALEKMGASRAFIAVEPHKYEGIHLHALSRQHPWDDGVKPGTIWKYCFKAFGRTTVDKIDGVVAVSRYCAKYVVKENQFEFMGDKHAWLKDS